MVTLSLHLVRGGGIFLFVVENIDFLKSTSLIFMDKKDFMGLAEDTITFAELEELNAHANAIKIRMD